MLLAPNLEQCMGHPAADARWRALWEMLAVNRQAVGLEVPRTDAPAAGACPGASVPLGKSSGSDGGTEGDGGGSSSSSLLLALVPNIFDPANMTMLGLLAAPLQREPRMPATAGHAAATRSILRRSGASVQQAEGAAAVAAAEPAVAAEVASLDAVVAEGEAADRLRRPLVWADSGSNDKQALELDIGSHYASPGRRAALAARPCRLPTIRSFEEVQAGSSSGGNSPKPLEGLRVALVGFGKQYEVCAARGCTAGGWGEGKKAEGRGRGGEGMLHMCQPSVPATSQPPAYGYRVPHPNNPSHTHHAVPACS